MRKLSFFSSGGDVMIALLFMLLLSSPACAQSGSNVNHVMFSVAALIERGFDATLSYEHDTRYRNKWEYFGQAYLQYDDDPEAGHITSKSFWNNYHTWMLGIAYKPCIFRRRNNHGNLRLGVLAGSDTKKFIAGGTVGYEHSFALRRGWEFFFQLKSDIVIGGKTRAGVAIGMKVPLIN